MSTEWLAIQGLQQDQDLLAAINTLSIHTKLRLAGVADDEQKAKDVAEAQQELTSFLETMEGVFDQVERIEKGALIGLDPHWRNLVRSFVAARRDRHRFRSKLFEGRPSTVVDLLESTGREDQERLVEVLSDLRNLVEEHAHKSTHQILGDF